MFSLEYQMDLSTNMNIRYSRYLINMMLSSQKLEQLILTSYRQKIEQWQQMIESRSRQNNNNNNNNSDDWSKICGFLIEVFGEHCELQRKLGDHYGTLLSSLIQSKAKIDNQCKQENNKKAQIMAQLIGQDPKNTMDVKMEKGNSDEKVQALARQVQLQPQVQAHEQANDQPHLDLQSQSQLQHVQLESSSEDNVITKNSTSIVEFNTSGDQIFEKIFQNYQSMNCNSSLTLSNNINKNNNNNNNNNSNSNVNSNNNVFNSDISVSDTLTNTRIKTFSAINDLGLSNFLQNDTRKKFENVIQSSPLLLNLTLPPTSTNASKNKDKDNEKEKEKNKDKSSKNKSNKKGFVCGECGREFKLQRHFCAHMRIHQGLGFQCSHCPRIFARKSNLTQHLRTQFS